MRKLFMLLVVAAVALLAAYVAGYWPQRERLSALDAEKAQLQQQLQVAEARVRAAALLGELLALKETVQEMNYGQARSLSSPFFDHVRAEIARAADPAVKQALDSIQAVRDPVTVALTQGDASALGHLREGERRLRTALGYPVPATPAPLPASAAPPLLPAPPGAASPALPSPGGNPLGTAPTPSPSI
jgi:hypothetical protein